MKDSENKTTEQEHFTTSRRDFLKGAAVTGAAAALSGVMLGATGCSSDDTGTNGDSATPSASNQYRPPVYESDVLIIGGGLTGLMAAKTALATGASVNVVDKGPWGHSGTSGINWGHDMQTAEYGTDDGTEAASLMPLIMCGMPNQTLMHAACKANMESKPNVTSETLGMVLERNLEDGEVKGTTDGIVFTLNHGFYNRYYALHVRHEGAGVFDRTRVLDILRSDEGGVAGAVAISVRTGEPIVFRAKKTILATGSYGWAAGNNGLYPYSMCGPENTGDGIAMLIKAGIAMRDMEQLPCDFVQWTPMGTRQGMGTLGASIVNHWMVYDKDYNRITEQWDENGLFSNAEFMQACFGAIHQGRGTENGGIYIETSTLEDASNDKYYRMQRADERRLGYELPEFVEAVGEQWESAAYPFDVSTSCETEISGLYYASAALGTWNGTAYFACQATGYLAGKDAGETSQSVSECPAFDWDQVRIALDEAYGLIEANPADGIRSNELCQKVQETYWSGLSPFRNEEGIQNTLDELDRIEYEDLEKMVIPSKSRQLNLDWQRALDVKSLIACAKGTGHAAMLREETRGAHCRTDYPKPDNANWMVNTKVQFKNGNWSAELVDIDDSLVPKDVLIDTVLEIGLEYDH